MNTRDRNHSASALRRAVRDGDSNAVSEILRRADDTVINATDTQGRSALDIALQEGKGYTIVSSLVREGANVTADNICHATLSSGYAILSTLLGSRIAIPINETDGNGWTPLQCAVYGDVGYAIMSTLLNHGALPNVVDPRGSTVLHRAIKKSLGYSYISTLLNHGAEPNIVDAEGFTCLHHAIENNREYSIISALLNHGADVNKVNPQGMNSIHLSLQHNLGYSTISSIVSHNGDVNSVDSNGRTVLHLVMMTNEQDINIVDCFLSARGANCNIQDNSGKAPLHHHAILGEKQEPDSDEDEELPANAQDIARQLIPEVVDEFRRMRAQMRAQHREADRRMRTHLRESVRRMHGRQRALDRVMAQMNGGMDIDIFDEYMIDQDTGDGTIVSALICAGADVNLVDNTGATPLLYAAQAGHSTISAALLKAGADPSRARGDGMCPLHVAIQGRHFDIVEQLLDAGANPNIADSSGKTSLHFSAAIEDSNQTLGLLIQYGGLINQRDNHGETALHCAVANGILVNVETLLGSGASALFVDINGKSLLHYAPSMAIVEVLLQAGADLHHKDASGLTPLLQHASTDSDLNFIFDLLIKSPQQLDVEK